MCPLIPNDSLTKWNIVGWKFFCFWHFEYFVPFLLAFKVFAEKKSVDSLIGDTSYVTSWFPLDAFRIVSCSLTLATSIIMYLGVKLLQYSSVTQSHPTLCDLMDCSRPGFPVHHQLPELAQIHVHWVGDTIQSSHPLASFSPPAFNLSYHQGLFKSVSFSHQAAKVLKFQLQHQSFQWIFRTDFL